MRRLGNGEAGLLIGESSKAWEAIDAIGEQVGQLPATTLQGFPVKARIAALIWFWPLWREPFNDLDPDKQVMRRFVEDLVAATGLSLPTALTELA